jgi:hypothetical protein
MLTLTLCLSPVQLDPNDPRNYHLLELLSAAKEQDSEKYVRFDTMYDGARIGEVLFVRLCVCICMYVCVRTNVRMFVCMFVNNVCTNIVDVYTYC